MAGIGYLMVGTNDLERARGFYDALFAVVDGKRGFSSPTSQGYSFGGGPMFSVTLPRNGEPATIGNGSMVALNVGNKEKVAEMHAKALELGGTCEGPPGPRGSFGTFAYFRDLDGNKLAAFVMGQ
jgi:catechol 2,3-dioxygenase-like lactoylglutathione lyase family enzyme